MAALVRIYGDPANSVILQAAAHSIKVLPETAQKQLPYVATEDGKVAAQQCLASTQLECRVH